jgi:CBS domain-containing protein
MRTFEACQKTVVTTVERASLADVAKLMRDNHVGSVVVIDPPGSGIPVGILTDRDIVVSAVAANQDPRTLSAGEVMTRDVVTALEDDDASWSLKVMRDRGIRRLPVVNRDGVLTGILALDDLLYGFTTTMVDAVQAVGVGRLVESFRRTP